MFKSFSLVVIAALCAIVFSFEACSKNQAQSTIAPAESSVTISQDGNKISFHPNAPQLKQFTIDTVHESALKLDMTAPVHTLVSVIQSGENKLDLFETQDLTDTYSAYQTAMANVQHSSLALARTKDLYSHNLVASKDLEDAEQDFATQQASLADDDAKLRAAGIDPHELNEAPVGTVWVIADVPEEQITSITPGMRVDIEYVSYPGKLFSGRLAAIGQAIDPTTRKFKVRLALANPNGELRPAMFGTAHFVASSDRAVTVPETAVVREGDGTMSAWVTRDGYTFTRKTVTIGLQEESNYQIIAGLAPGECVVTSGGVFLSNMNESQDPQG